MLEPADQLVWALLVGFWCSCWHLWALGGEQSLWGGGGGVKLEILIAVVPDILT